MTLKAVVITASGDTRIEQLTGGLASQSEQMGKLVGGYFTIAPSDALYFFCNENGDRLGLPRNNLASLIGYANGLAQGFVGDVVVTGPATRSGETTDVPRSFLREMGLPDRD